MPYNSVERGVLMDRTVKAKKQIYQALESLSPDALAEVARIVSSMERRNAESPLHLGGIWKDIPFDLDNRTVRSLRRRISREALKRKT